MSVEKMIEKLQYLCQIEGKQATDPVTVADLAYILNGGLEGAPVSRRKFVAPSLQDVTAYCVLRNNGVDPKKFWNYYEANGWRVGKNPMKDWQAAVRTWERDSFTGGKNDSMFSQEEGRL